MTKFVFLMVVFLLTSCNPMGKERQVLEQNSNLQFIELWRADRSCGYRYALQPALKLCVQGSGGVSPSDLEKHKGLAVNALGEWLKSIKSIEPLATTRVEFSCVQPHVRMNVVPGDGISTGRPGSINIYAQTGFGTQLHEWGHAFACLGDTYEGRTAGKCKPGQPESIMCWGEYGLDKLYPDDIQGIQAVFARNRSIVLPSNSLTQPIQNDLDDSKQNIANRNLPKDLKILVKRSKQNNQTPSSTQRVIVLSAPASVDKVWVCAGAFYNSCDQATHGALEAKFVSAKSNRKIFQGPFINGAAINQKLVIEGFDSVGQTRQRRILQIKSK